MTTDLNARPFTAALNATRRERGLRYTDLQNLSNEARSSAWFNTICNRSDPWAVGPPDREAIPGLAMLLQVSEQQVREWISREWYQVRPRRVVPRSARAREFDPVLNALSEQDLARVLDLAERLAA